MSGETLPQIQAVSPSNRTHWLELRGNSVPLSGETTIGRSPECAVVLDDHLASRRHAKIVITPNATIIQDLGSANGVLLRGVKIEQPTVLESGDEIVIGQQRMRYRVHATEVRVRDDTIATGVQTVPRDTAIAEEDATGRANAVDLLGGIADKALALGDVAEAVRVLTPLLEAALEDVKVGRSVDPSMKASLESYALKLALATRRGKWIDYLLALYSTLVVPMPIETVDRLYEVAPKVDRIALGPFSEYLAALRRRDLTPSERFAQKRLEGLEKIFRLKA